MTDVITFTGAQGTGKTTMRGELVRYLQDEGMKVMDRYSGVKESVARDAKTFGFTINEQTNFVTQYYIAHRYIIADLETRKIAERTRVDFIVVDRSVLDVIPYTNASSMLDREKHLIQFMLLQHYKLFPTDLVYCSPLGFIDKDKDRSVDEDFQNKIVDEFKKMLVKVSDISPPICLDNMPTEDRLQILKSHLNL